jgi:hypothetical protein
VRGTSDGEYRQQQQILGQICCVAHLQSYVAQHGQDSAVIDHVARLTRDDDDADGTSVKIILGIAASRLMLPRQNYCWRWC